MLLPFKLMAAGGVRASLAQVGSKTGIELNVNHSLKLGADTTLKLNYLEFFLSRGEADPSFGKYTASNGVESCRDQRTGQFAKKENCETPTSFKYTPSIELSQKIRERISLGLGLKIEPIKSSSIFASIYYATSEALQINLRVGNQYAALGGELLF